MRNIYEHLAEKHHFTNTAHVENTITWFLDSPGEISINIRQIIVKSLIGWNYENQAEDITLCKSEIQTISELEFVAEQLWDLHKSKKTKT